MENYQSLMEIQTFQNNIGLSLYIVPFITSHKVVISEKELGK